MISPTSGTAGRCRVPDSSGGVIGSSRAAHETACAPLVAGDRPSRGEWRNCAEAGETKTEWTEADYPTVSWHDNHVHGLQIRAGEHGSGTSFSTSITSLSGCAGRPRRARFDWPRRLRRSTMSRTCACELPSELGLRLSRFSMGEIKQEAIRRGS